MPSKLNIQSTPPPIPCAGVRLVAAHCATPSVKPAPRRACTRLSRDGSGICNCRRYAIKSAGESPSENPPGGSGPGAVSSTHTWIAQGSGMACSIMLSATFAPKLCPISALGIMRSWRSSAWISAAADATVFDELINLCFSHSGVDSPWQRRSTRMNCHCGASRASSCAKDFRLRLAPMTPCSITAVGGRRMVLLSVPWTIS
mmetsp:Transcript_5303/g.19394  ORF Transcript_5303/g.19394 Transcript_5303/m.19394 type:complete len:202 (+) Transcript_5303:1348-1953(+)